MQMQSSSESGRVAYCLPVGITSSKTKCVRLRNGRSLQHPKQISARAIVDATVQLHCLYSQLRNCVVQELSAKCSRVFVVRRSDRRESDGMGHVCTTDTFELFKSSYNFYYS